MSVQSHRPAGTNALTIGEMQPFRGAFTAKTEKKYATHDGCKPKELMDAEEQAWRDAQPMVTRCLHCDWSYAGPAGKARYEWEQHVAAEHPNVRLKKSRGSSKTASELQRDEAMKGVAQRAQAATASDKREEEEPPMEHQDHRAAPPQVAVDYPCKAPGCTNRTPLNKGRYAYTCPDHRAVGKTAAARTKRAPAKPTTSTNGKAPRDRLQVLHDMVVKEQDLINARAHVAELEQSFSALADEFSKAAA